METINKTVMEEWAESSVDFSNAIKKLLNEFNFDDIYNVKKKIRNYFPKEYLTVCETYGSLRKISNNHFLSPYSMQWEEMSAIDLAKAILFASAFLETTDMRTIIEWANI